MWERKMGKLCVVEEDDGRSKIGSVKRPASNWWKGRSVWKWPLRSLSDNAPWRWVHHHIFEELPFYMNVTASRETTNLAASDSSEPQDPSKNPKWSWYCLHRKIGKPAQCTWLISAQQCYVLSAIAIAQATLLKVQCRTCKWPARALRTLRKPLLEYRTGCLQRVDNLGRWLSLHPICAIANPCGT